MSLFGAKPAGSVFGQNTNTTSSPFGQSTNSPFGAGANNQGGGGGGLFGQSTAQNNQNQPQSGGGLFGQPASQNNQNQNQNQSGGLFGQSTAQNNQTQPQNQTGGLFGQSTAQNTQNQTSAFGGGSSLFGQSQANQQQQQQQQQPQQPQQQQQQQPAAAGASFMGASQNPQAQRPSLIWEPGRESSQNQKPVTEQMAAILSKWNPSDQSTVYKYYFYNKVDQSRIPFYQPGPGEDAREWDQAVHDKPGPGYMPALATGFRAVGERLLMQRSILAQYNQALHQINATLDAILSNHDIQTSVRAVNARRKHAVLRQRCLALASKVQVLRNRGYALDKEEDELKSKLEDLDRGMSDPALSARTEELWSRLIMLRNTADSLKSEINRRGTETQEGLGEETEARAKKILEDYDKQLQHLKSQLEKIRQDYEEWQKDSESSGKQ